MNPNPYSNIDDPAILCGVDQSEGELFDELYDLRALSVSIATMQIVHYSLMNAKMEISKIPARQLVTILQKHTLLQEDEIIRAIDIALQFGK